MPTPKPTKATLVRGLLIGLATGLLLFGGTGFGLGRLTTSADGPQPAQSGSATLGAWEKSQSELAKSKFPGDLANLSQHWLPTLSGCMRDIEANGPKLGEGETARVFCFSGNISLYFVQFRSSADRDKARTVRLGQNSDARTLTPGAAEPAQNKDGYDYIEYAAKDNSQRVIGGIWWNSTDKPIAAYALAYWNENMGTRWEPFRELWQRYR